MNQTWVDRTVADVCALVTSGGTPSRRVTEYFGRSIPWLKTQELRDGWVYDTEEYITQEGLLNSSAKLLPSGSVLMAMYGATVGKLAILGRQMSCNQAACAMIADPQSTDNRFLYYLLLNDRLRIIDLANGAAQQNLNVGTIKALRYRFPPIAEQRAIAATLGALDGKIESNRRAIGVAESLADQLFTVKMADAVTLADVAALTMGSSPPGDTYNEDGEGLPFYQGVRDFGRRFPGRRVWTTGAIRLAHDNDSLVSVRAPVGELNRSRETCCIGRGVAAVRSESPSCIYYALRASDATWEPFQHEGTVFGAINKAELSNARLFWPAPDELDSLENQLSAIDEKIRSWSKEIEKLTALRDALLPELLSGRIRVSEAEEAST